jgi:transcription elongation factor Elf1
MPENIEAAIEIKETDIVFDCPHCGKSLAIDYRGAGLTIPCTDCGNFVEVPIPPGMELVDLDSNEEEQEVRIVNLRRALGDTELRIRRLEEELDAVMSRREALELARTAGLARDKAVRDNLDALKRIAADLNRAVETLTAAMAAGPAE